MTSSIGVLDVGLTHDVDFISIVMGAFEIAGSVEVLPSGGVHESGNPSALES